jgi:alpha-glutamyl/putrescinyl thymine pyrophosphorylase clade 1
VTNRVTARPVRPDGNEPVDGPDTLGDQRPGWLHQQVRARRYGAGVTLTLSSLGLDTHPLTVLPAAAADNVFRVGTRTVRTTAVFHSYWHFARARQDVHQRRLDGLPGPWTDDAALLHYRFTNAFRVTDRVSQDLLRAQRDGEDDPYEVLFRTLLFRCFNRPETFRVLAAALGHVPSWRAFDVNRYDRILGQHLAAGHRLYSAAYIIPAPPFGYARKHRNHLALLEHVMADSRADALVAAQDLAQLYPLLLELPGLGPFLAFQLAVDLGYAAPWALSEGDFVIAGPGAASGIRKCFRDTGGLSAAQIIHWMADTQAEHFAARGLTPVTLHGRPLQPIDCQNLFCETDKYARVMHPDIVGIGQRLRIKQRFAAAGPLAPPLYPAHWKLPAA